MTAILHESREKWKRKDHRVLKELTRNQKRQQRTVLYICLLIALMTLLVAASYTWLSISRTPRVSNMDIYVSGQTGLELSSAYDAPDDKWGTVLDFKEIVGVETQLKPATWSQKEQTLKTMLYGLDGRMTGEYETLSDEKNANRKDADGYYVKGTFYARSDSAVTVSLGEAVEVNGGENTAGTYVIGTPVWNEQTLLHDDGGQGAETAIRLGLRITKVSPDTGAAQGSGEFYIYEPNCDTHISSSASDVAETKSIDGEDTLIDTAHLIRQTASRWSEASPVLSSVTIKSLGRFTTPTRLFTLQPGEIAAIELYIWLEGQDMDCTNVIDEAQIIANLQFATDYDGQGGLVDIPG